jgi:hypothetical protein
MIVFMYRLTNIAITLFLRAPTWQKVVVIAFFLIAAAIGAVADNKPTPTAPVHELHCVYVPAGNGWPGGEVCPYNP